jgi:hypothetical protein
MMVPSGSIELRCYSGVGWFCIFTHFAAAGYRTKTPNSMICISLQLVVF